MREKARKAVLPTAVQFGNAVDALGFLVASVQRRSPVQVAHLQLRRVLPGSSDEASGQKTT